MVVNEFLLLIFFAKTLPTINVPLCFPKNASVARKEKKLIILHDFIQFHKLSSFY